MVRRLLFVFILFLLPAAQVQAAAQPRSNDTYGRAVSNIIASKIKSQGIAANDPKYSAALYRVAEAANDAIYAAGTASTVAGTIGAVVGAPAWASLAVGLLAAGAVVGLYVWLGDDSTSNVKADGTISASKAPTSSNPGLITDLENEILTGMAGTSDLTLYQAHVNNGLASNKLYTSCHQSGTGFPVESRKYRGYFSAPYANDQLHMCGGSMAEVLQYAAAWYRGGLAYLKWECAKADMEWACDGAVFPSTVEIKDISCKARQPGNGYSYFDCSASPLMRVLYNQWKVNTTSDISAILEPRFTIETTGNVVTNTNIGTIANQTQSGESYVDHSVLMESANALINAVNPWLQQNHGFQIGRIEIEDVENEYISRPSTFPRYNDYYGKPARNIDSGTNAGKPDFGTPLREPVDTPELPPNPNPDPDPDPEPNPDPDPEPNPNPNIDTSTLAKESTVAAIKTKLENLVDWFTGSSPEPSNPAEKNASDFTPVFQNPEMNTLKGWSMPAHSSECPKASFSVWNQDFTVDAHCSLLDQHKATIAASMAAVWLVMALFVALSA